MMRACFTVSPSGPISVGAARIALLGYLHARRHSGRFRLRFYDVGNDHARADYVAAIERELRWLGIDWDESQRQSQGLSEYLQAFERLQRTGRVYPAVDNRESRTKRGSQSCWKFRLSDRTVGWHDLVLGPCTVALHAIADPVVLQADGTPAACLAGVVDDIATDVTDVIRCRTSVQATAVEVDLRAALDHGRGPRFAHLPALEDAGEKRLARRVDARTLRSLRRDGVENVALAAYLARLGTQDAVEPTSLPQLSTTFDLGHFSPQPAPFKAATLLALNRRVLASSDLTSVKDRLPPGATEAFWLAIRTELDLLGEARGWWDVVAGSIVPPRVAETRLLGLALDLLPHEPWNGTVWHDWIDALARASGWCAEALALPLRLALTGEDGGPELAALLPLIGRARAIQRLRLALQ